MSDMLRSDGPQNPALSEHRRGTMTLQPLSFHGGHIASLKILIMCVLLKSGPAMRDTVLGCVLATH